MKFPRVSVIILNWNGWKDTIECLESLYRISYPNYDVVVVDNGSGDDSVQKIREYAKGEIEVNSKFFEYNPENKPIKVFEISEYEARGGRFNRSLYEKFDPDRRMILIKNKDNYGFAGGNNVGIKFALSVLNPRFVLLLNNDTVVTKEFIDNLVGCYSSSLNVGAISPTVYEYSEPRIVQYRGERFNRLTGLPEPMDEMPNLSIDCGLTELITGACVLIPSNIIRRYNLLWPEVYTAYWEDIDYSLGLIQNGHVNIVSRLSKIYHKGSSSLGKVSTSRIQLAVQSKLIFTFLRNNNQVLFPSLTVVIYLINWIGGILLNRNKGWKESLVNLKRWGLGVLRGIDSFLSGLH